MRDEDEYLLAYYIVEHILKKEYGNPEKMIEDVMQEFKIDRQEAARILDSNAFNKMLDQRIRLKELSHLSKVVEEAIQAGNIIEGKYVLKILNKKRRR